MITPLHTNSCCYFNLICGTDKGVNFMLQGIKIETITGLVPVAFFSMYRICVLFRHFEGHLHARWCCFRSVLLYACDAQTRYVGWIITVKEFYLLTGSRKLGACQLLLFHSGPYHLYSQGQINTVWLYSRLQIIYSHTVWIYISRELVWRQLVNSQHMRADKDTIPVLLKAHFSITLVKMMIICQTGV